MFHLTEYWAIKCLHHSQFRLTAEWIDEYEKKIVSQCSFLKPLRICVWNFQILNIGLQNIIQRKREANSGCTFSFVLFNISGEKEEYEQLFKRFSWHTQKNPKNPIKLQNYDWINRRFILLLQEKYSRGGKKQWNTKNIKMFFFWSNLGL